MENNSLLLGVWKKAFRFFCRALGMKLNRVVAIGAILTLSSCARTVEGEGRPQVAVCMEWNNAQLDVIRRARGLTTRMFDQIGVALVWRGLEHCPEELRPIVILLSLDTPRKVFPGALAISYPFEGVHIRVFYDRLRTVTESCPLPVLLAHVLAHEIGHILQRTNGHSASGVMKSPWDTSDYMRMARQPLPFTDLDIQLIYRGLDSRTGRLSGERLSEVASGIRPAF